MSWRNSYDTLKRYRCAKTVLTGFVLTQHFCGFMSSYDSYHLHLLLTQTAEKLTNGTNVGMQSPRFIFHRLGRCKSSFVFHIESESGRKCKSAFIFILKTSQDKVKRTRTCSNQHWNQRMCSYNSRSYNWMCSYNSRSYNFQWAA